VDLLLLVGSLVGCFKMEKNFECKKCGWCCKNFSQEKGVNGLPLFEWEKKKFEELAEEKGIKLDIQPTDLIFDKRSNRHICVNYSMKNEPCPFLENNQCSIYTDRPLVCKSFPLAKSPLIPSKDGILNLSGFMKCEHFDNEQFMIHGLGLKKEGVGVHLDKPFMIKKYSEVYGDEPLIYSSIRQMIEEFIDETIKKLIEDKKVKFRKVSKFDLDKFAPTSIFDFFIIKGLMDETAKETTIKKLRDPTFIQETINELKKKNN